MRGPEVEGNGYAIPRSATGKNATKCHRLMVRGHPNAPAGETCGACAHFDLDSTALAGHCRRGPAGIMWSRANDACGLWKERKG